MSAVIALFAAIGATCSGRWLWRHALRRWHEFRAHHGGGLCICGDETCHAFPQVRCAGCGRLATQQHGVPNCSMPTISRRAWRHLQALIQRAERIERAT